MKPELDNGRRRWRYRGVTLVEVLIAGIVVSTSVVGLVEFIYVDFNMTRNTSRISAAESAGRMAVERVRLEGFTNAPEGSTTVYCDANGTYPPSLTMLSSSIFSITTTVTSDMFNGLNPAPGSLRTVCVTVNEIATGAQVFQTYTSLANGGV